jgi:hypothetical protein
MISHAFKTCFKDHVDISGKAIIWYSNGFAGYKSALLFGFCYVNHAVYFENVPIRISQLSSLTIEACDDIVKLKVLLKYVSIVLILHNRTCLALVG